MKISASSLRQNIYKILDEVIATGTPIEIERNGNILKIIPTDRQHSKLEKLKRRILTDEDSDAFAHIDWTHEWKPK